jgi:hypothetical protein
MTSTIGTDIGYTGLTIFCNCGNLLKNGCNQLISFLTSGIIEGPLAPLLPGNASTYEVETFR